MGSAITPHTALGRRAEPLRRRVNLLIRRIGSNPPKGVGVYGGKYSVTPLGYLGRRLYTFALEHEGSEFVWNSPMTATDYLRTLSRGRSGRTKQNSVLERLLPVLEKEFPRIEHQVNGVVDPGGPLVREPAPEPIPALPEPEKPAQRPVEGDPEIAAIANVKLALDELDGAARRRVISYVSDRFLSD